MSKKISITFFFIFNLLIVQSQNTRITDRNTIGWYNQFVNFKLSSKWSGHLEYQWRRDNLLTNWQQSLLRVGLGYQFNQKLHLRLGYAWVETFPYGDFNLQAAGKTFPEHRFFQMASLSDQVGTLSFNHRFMLEQRWIGRFTQPTLEKADDFNYANRMRYMVRIQKAIKTNKYADTELYASLYDEVFIGFGKNVNENVFDQNRLGLLLGYRFNKQFRLEGGFIQQILQLGREIDSRNVFQYNNGVILNSIIQLDFSRKKTKS